ncbi:MAG: radical SAM protein [Elusimicrobia bacterium]|nr:radical SAM protein [Elusimicrobiota bacterium]
MNSASALPLQPSACRLACCVWEFTLRCNLNCMHCGSSAGSARAGELSTEEALKLCDDLKKAGCLGVALMGGEPFLRGDFFEVASCVRELGMELSVITNGTVQSGEIFENLKKLKPRAVAVSIDASTAALHDKIRGVPGAFDKSQAFIDRCLREGLPVSVITAVHKFNLKDLAAIRNSLKGRKIAWQVQTVGGEGRRFPKEMLLDEEEFYSVGVFIEASRRTHSSEELPLIGAHDLGYNSGVLKNISLYEKWEGCQAGVSVLGIRSNGDALGCLALNDDRFIEGNVRRKSVLQLWNGPAAFSYTRNFNGAQAGENCSSCAHVAACKGGCNEMSLMKTGVMHNDPYCFYRLEHKLFAEKLQNPFKRLWFRLNGLAHAGGGAFEKLGRIFGANRGLHETKHRLRL